MIDFVASLRIEPISIRWKSWGDEVLDMIDDYEDSMPISIKFNLLDTEIIK